MFPLAMQMNTIASDTLRFVTIAHGSIFVVFIILIILEGRRAICRGAKSVNGIKHEMYLLLSYLFAMMFMIAKVAQQLHHEFSWWITPVVLLCLLLGDISLYYLFLHRTDNKE